MMGKVMNGGANNNEFYIDKIQNFMKKAQMSAPDLS